LKAVGGILTTLRELEIVTNMSNLLDSHENDFIYGLLCELGGLKMLNIMVIVPASRAIRWDLAVLVEVLDKVGKNMCERKPGTIANFVQRVTSPKHRGYFLCISSMMPCY
jgi:hypothetical protein